MLNLVANGLNWKEIAQFYHFKLRKIDGKQIKNKFECVQRSKFNLLFREIYETEAIPKLSDSVLKIVMSEEQIMSKYEKGIIDELGKNSLSSKNYYILESLNFFNTYLGKDDKPLRTDKDKR